MTANINTKNTPKIHLTRDAVFPKFLERWFTPDMLARGQAHYLAGALSGFNFFRKVHKAICHDGNRDYFCYYLDGVPSRKQFKEIGICTCQCMGNNFGCEHIAALLFHLFSPSRGEQLLTLDYPVSLPGKIAISLCRSHLKALPLSLNPGIESWGYSDNQGRKVLSVHNAPRDFYPDFVGLPGYDIRCSSKHFSNYCLKEITVEDKKQMKFIPKAPSLQEGLGPVGDVLRQFFLSVASFTGKLLFDADTLLYTLKLMPADVSWYMECVLTPEYAYLLYKNYKPQISLADSARINENEKKKVF
ncbi:MAG: hypothetical protein HQK83_09465, partial [Fibrobacteria bacterium]|nr:hypothetical protein [Fibrobacteria bacterium]